MQMTYIRVMCNNFVIRPLLRIRRNVLGAFSPVTMSTWGWEGVKTFTVDHEYFCNIETIGC